MAYNAGLGNSSLIGLTSKATSSATLSTAVANWGITPVRGGGTVINNVVVPYVPITFTEQCNPVYVQEKHVSVIRKGPTSPVSLEMFAYTRPDQQTAGDGAGFIDITAQFLGDDLNFLHGVTDPDTGIPTGEFISGFYKNNKDRKEAGDTFSIAVADNVTDLISGDTIIVSLEYDNSFGVKQKATCRAVIDENLVGAGAPIPCTLLTNTLGFPITTSELDIYKVKLVQEDPMFELKFPRFSYRYKYEDGEYSVFAPWSQIAFIPGEFDFMPKKGYNLGMTNRLRSLKIMDWVPKNIPKDVSQVDLLFKQSNSPNVYTVDSFKPDDVIVGIAPENPWNTPGTGRNMGNYTVTSELIHATVASNQMLRPWDNVPRVALAQEITANRLVFANYVQNYNTISNITTPPTEIKPMFEIAIDYTNIEENPLLVRLPGKSLKSMRSYQLGVVYRDRYGRETPVMTSNSGTFKIKKESAKNYNRINVGLSSEAPDWAESFTIYIKETANEYYNLSMDRWYNAEDGGIWVSFPSSERNKISDETVLYLKKQHDSDVPVDTEIEYKVISIENGAPTFIKTDKQYWGGVQMMLPPAGWGRKGKPGSWQAGMFGSTGLPLQGRLYLDVYAEYAAQTILEGLKSMTANGLEVRITQQAGDSNAYGATGADKANKSNWYGVSRVSFIGEEPSTYTEQYTDPSSGITTEVEVEEANAKHPLVRITLDKVMGPDMAFTEPTDNLDLARGLSLELQNEIVRNKSQFEGRFFVKLHRNNDLVRNIINPSNPVGDKLFVKESKGIKYLCDAHPGVQDWSSNVPDHRATTQTLVAPLTNYIPVGVDVWQGNTNAGTFGTGLHMGNYGTKDEGRPVSISSYSAAAAGASWSTPNTPSDQLAPVICNDWTTSADPFVGAQSYERGCWPFSPGPDNDTIWSGAGGNSGVHGWANKKGDPSWYGNRYKPHTDSHGQTPGSSSASYDWPSFFPSQWIPAHNTSRFRIKDPNATLPASLNAEFVLQDVIDKKQPLNPFLKPAIWGDDPFVGGAWKRHAFGTGLGMIGSAGIQMNWNYTTMARLNRDWLGYWNTGSGSDDTEWPFVRASWDRWFIDKVGAAENYAGSGIWDDENVSHIAISYWGIGNNSKPITDSHDLAFHQESELSFANFLSTVGTMFRFKQDPDQTIYTITDVQVEKVFNYEGFHGSWGYQLADDENGDPGALKGLAPPLGPTKKHELGIAGRHFFYSDIWQNSDGGLDRENTGRAMQNNRLRFNLTLDKKIGLGPNNFHPITNHVGPALNHPIHADGTMISNIQTLDGVRDRVPYDKTAADHVGIEKGGTPCPLGTAGDKTKTDYSANARYFMYNLASYWNAGDLSKIPSTGSNFEQPENIDHPFYTDSNNGNGVQIGLHERGLNETTIEIVEWYDGKETEQRMSNNPAVFETEPREDVGMDLYYAASPTYPVNLKRYRFDNDEDPGFYDYGLRGEEFIPVGSIAEDVATSTFSQVDGVQENRIWVNEPLPGLQDGTTPDGSGGFVPASNITFETKGEGTYYGINIDNNYTKGVVSRVITDKIFEIQPEVHSSQRSLSYFNCYSFGNGVESNRIRDDYNAITIDKGVKVSAPLAEGYKEERKASSFIFSGIYNSTSGINRTNEFIQAEPITKDLNPVNGSIQKLFSRDTDLVTFCENKVFRVLSKKDALFNADGNKNITSNAAVLGATTPFEGDYGMSRNPESFASESYRVYFADKDRGVVLRLSKSGLKPISSNGMKDWFKDNLMNASSLIGSYDGREDHYNLTIETKDQDNIDNAFTLSFTESKGGGWVSFKSFIHQAGITYKNKYYTFPSNKFNAAQTAVNSASEKLYGTDYGNGTGMAEMWQHHVDLDFHRYLTSAEVKGSDTITLSSGGGVIVIGMNVEGNGVPIDTTVIPGGFGNSIKLSNPVYIEAGGELRFTSARNNFYSLQSHSMVRTLFNGDQGTVKRFKTLNYEGSQGKTLQDTSDDYILSLYDTNNGESSINVGQVFNNNYAKNGWEVSQIKTDLQDGSIKEFLDKENKWFNYISGDVDAGFGDDVDTAEFSAQGLGFSNI
tara:strand:- start:201 stop:6377 length:6177 start_codon:yes stop_codon:yes gene_type:complete